MTLTFREAWDEWKLEHLPSLKLHYGEDMDALHEAWSSFVWQLFDDGRITEEQRQTWGNPYEVM